MTPLQDGSLQSKRLSKASRGQGRHNALATLFPLNNPGGEQWHGLGVNSGW